MVPRLAERARLLLLLPPTARNVIAMARDEFATVLCFTSEHVWFASLVADRQECSALLSPRSGHVQLSSIINAMPRIRKRKDRRETVVRHSLVHMAYCGVEAYSISGSAMPDPVIKTTTCPATTECSRR